MSSKEKQKITMFSISGFIWCAKTREFFKENKIKFKEIDVGKSEKEAMKMIELSGQNGTPVIQIGREIIVGFDEDKLNKLLKIK